MAKKITIQGTNLLTSKNDPWGGVNNTSSPITVYGTVVPPGAEWGMNKEEVERFLREQHISGAAQAALDGKVGGVIVNNHEVPKDANNKVSITVPTVSDDVADPTNPAAAQAGAVAAELNAMRSQPFGDVRLGDTSPDGSTVALEFYSQDDNENPFASVDIPAAQEIGEVIIPKITTELVTPARVKLGDSVMMRWQYDCIRRADGASERYAAGVAQTVVITAKIGQTVIYTETRAQVAPADTAYLVQLGPDIVNQAGTVSISVVATAMIDEEEKTSRGTKSVTVITMNLDTTFDPASQLAISNGYTNSYGQIAIPYTYTVPAGTTLKVWVDGVLDATSTISGTGRNYIYLTAANLSAGRHNVQMIADSSGLLSNAVSVDLLKAGGSGDYLGMRLKAAVESMSDMPLPYNYGVSSEVQLPMAVGQFEELSIDIGAWNAGSLTTPVIVAVDGSAMQTIAAGRSMQTVKQRFDAAGTHVMTISVGSASGAAAIRSFAVEVASAAGVTEVETPGFRAKLTAAGRSNSESAPAVWEYTPEGAERPTAQTEFIGVDWNTNGWNRGSDGVDALLLTNGAKAVVNIQPFVQDVQDGDYSIQTRGMSLEMEMMISQVMERGATILSCLCDNDGEGYPMGVKVTTDEAGLFFGGVERIKTAEDETDEHGDPIPDPEEPDGIKKIVIERPHGVAMNIAVDRWVRVSFVVQPISDGYGLAMLFINGVLSRANSYTNSLRQTTPASLTFDSDKANIRIRSIHYYRFPMIADESLANWIISRPTALGIMAAHNDNAVGDASSTTDTDGNIAVSRDALLQRGRGVLTIIRSEDAGYGLYDLFLGPNSTDKKWNFKADLVRWEPPLDAQGNPIGEGFEARNVRIRIQGTSSVKYPYKNIRIYLTTQQGDVARVLIIGGQDVTATAKGYALRGSGNSIVQSVLCAKTDFVDSSLTMNTGGAHLFNNTMHSLGLDTPPQAYDARVRQAIDGIPCDIFAGTSEQGALTYCGQFVLNNEKSKSGGIFGMEGVDGFSGDPSLNPMSIALEALNNQSPMTLFQPAGPAGSDALKNQLAAVFDDGFEFNYPEDAKWANVNEGQWDDEKGKWAVKPVDAVIEDAAGNEWTGARGAIERLMGWIYDCVPSAMRTNPDYGTRNGWSDASKAKWVSQKFKDEISQYFNLNHLLTYYLFTDYWASVDQRAKNILWRTWDGLKWWATYYDGDTAMSIRNDAFMVYLYSVTRDTYDSERNKYAFEGHNSWLWCLVLANFEAELKQCAASLRGILQTQVMLDEFNGVMMGNWSARQYNKSGKLKYIDTMSRMNYVYTLTGNREMHRTQFLTDRARLLDARYGSGEYDGDVMTFTVVRNASDTVSSLTLKSADLYYFGYKLNGIWLQGPSKADVGESLTMQFTQKLATNDPLMLGGASCISELDLTNMRNQLNGAVGLSLCTRLSKLVMPATYGTVNAPLTLGNISKLEYVDITGQTAVHTGTVGIFDLSKHTRLKTLLAGGTSLTTVRLPEGSPLEMLVMPASLTTLTLRYLPKLTPGGLTLSGTDNITALNFAECPLLSWRDLLEQCPNIDHVRIEGMSGRVMSSAIRPFMNGYHGLTPTGAEQTYPALIGKVQLIDVVDDFAEMQTFFAQCGLEVLEAQYTDYVFDDLESDPANITNEDNQTGYAYREQGAVYDIDKPNGYTASGHVKLIHDHCVPVTAYVNPETHKMHVEPLSKSNYSKLADGITASDITGSNIMLNRDVFLYVPHYFYKGVNDYKNAKKHFLPSFRTTAPDSTATRSDRLLLSSLTSYANKVPLASRCTVGQQMGELYDVPDYTTFRVDVEGAAQVRFPGYNDIDGIICHAFTDVDGKVIASTTLTMTSQNGNPADFDNTIGDYDFRAVPAGAKYLYFAVLTSVATLYAGGGEVPQGAMGAVMDGNTLTGYNAVLLTDSEEIEAIEPDWVEHLSELVGVYQGYASGITTGGTPTSGLRSISGKAVSRGNGTSTIHQWTYDNTTYHVTDLPGGAVNGTAQDFFNLADVRTKLSGVVNGEFSTVPYETSKDLANLMMAWFGTRDIETVVGRGSSAGETTGVTNQFAFGDSNYAGENQHNRMWGIECWTASTYEWMDKGCLNAPSFARFFRNHRVELSSWAVDYFYNIVQQDGRERRVKAATANQASNVARVRFGRFCDIVVSAYAGDSVYATCYAAYQASNSGKGRVLGRSYSSANASAGVVFVGANYAASYSLTGSGARLCFFGELENESELL